MTNESPEPHKGRSVTRRMFLGMSLASGAALLAGKSDVIFGAQSSTTPKMAMNTTFKLSGDLTVNRLGFGAMRITGEGIWGWPPDRANALKVLRRVTDLGVDLIDTADAYGPDTSELLIAEALHPYPKGLVIATKGGLTRPGPGEWVPNCRPEHLKQAVEGSLKRLRLERMEEVLAGCGFGGTAAAIEQAYRRLWRRCHDLYWSVDRDVPCRRQIEHFLEALLLDPLYARG